MRLGLVEITASAEYVETRFPSGRALIAAIATQPGQDKTAADLGFDSPEAMNREHDIAHSLLAHWLGLPWSPNIYALAHGEPISDQHVTEEAAVLALQKYARAAGVDLLALVARHDGEFACRE